MWTKEQGTSGGDVGYGVAVSGDGLVYVTGSAGGSLNSQVYKGRHNTTTIAFILLTY